MVAVALGVPFLLLVPWLDGDVVPLPLGSVQSMVPGGEQVAPVPHDLLNDTVLQLLPWEQEVRRAYQEGRLPLWSERLEGGSSPWVNPQAVVLAPLSSAARLLPIERSPLALLLLKLMVAIEGAWILGRTVGAGRSAALLAGLGFGLGGGMVGWALYPLAEVTAWLPWLVAGAIVVGRRPTPRAIVAVGVITATVLLSGHPETAFAGCLLAALAGLTLRRVRRGWRRTLLPLGLAACLGAGLAAVQWLPFITYVPRTFKADFVENSHAEPRPAGPTRGLTYPGASWALVAPLHPSTFGRPYVDEHLGPGNWAATAPLYGGLVALAGLLGALARPSRRVVPFLATVLVCLLLAIGFAPLLSLHGVVPLLAASNANRYLMAGSVAVAAVSALGLDRLLRGPSAEGWWRRLGLGLTGCLLVSLVLPWLRAVPWSPRIALCWLLLLMAATARRFTKAQRLVALLLVVGLDLGPWARAHIPRSPASHWPRTTELVDQIRHRADPGSWRVVGQGRAAYPGVLPWLGLAELRPHNSIADARQVRGLMAVLGFDPGQEYFARSRARDHPFLDFLNVRVVVQKTQQSGAWGMELRDRALPRVFLAQRSRWIEEEQIEGALESLSDARVVLHPAGAQGVTAGTERQWAEGTVRFVERWDGHAVVATSSPGPSLLATSWPQPEGWTARVDGGELQSAQRINGAYAAFDLPPGDHRVELRFVPPGFVPGAVLSLLSTVLAAVGLTVARWKERLRLRLD